MNSNKNYLVSNTFFMMAYTISSTGLNAVFWWLAARLYLPEMVGLAVVLISMAQLLTTMAQLGMNFGLIRFFQSTEEKGRLLSTAILACISIGFGVGLLTILIGPRVSSSLTILNSNFLTALFFLSLVVFLALFQLCYPILVVINKADFYFVFNLLVLLSRILFLLLGVESSRSFSMLFAFTTPLILADLYIIIIYLPKQIPGFSIWTRFDKILWKKIGGYSLASFVGNILHDLPYQIIPQVVANSAGLASAAYFYFPWALSGLLITFSSTISQSLFVEGANRPASFQGKRTKVFFVSLGIAIAGVVSLFLAGRPLLGLFGSEYAIQGVPILLILCLSVLPAAIVYHRVAILRVQKNTTAIIFIYGLILSLWVVFAYGLQIAKNALWISWCWFGAYLLASIVVWFLEGQKREEQV